MKSGLWYKDAIFYEVHVKAFYDADNDGIGDFRGLTARLDYLHDLGITCVWLLPFYPSPMNDDGYDISDYYDVHPDYGTLEDFKDFLKAAHERDIRVIADMVVNHTSIEHPWFQAARSDPKSPYRDYYVWSDTLEKYNEARIIFTDTERSNWAWDEVSKCYYWHRFFSHQPDLNFENPRVQEEVFDIVDFWLDIGLDGFRVDAVPYFFEAEGTSCENLPETHEFLKSLRRHIDEKYPGRLLLAEANQWPSEVSAYFGDGDEFHMAFNFPLMPRLFMSLQSEDRTPTVDIIEGLPTIPDNCQWCTFLRNHDELTLEMVTEEERTFMWNHYAQDSEARLNLGIRRRLAPLLGNDRRSLKLLNALLFSLPGSPILYYGDEIGMGDNLSLDDRNSVRTPMQWNIDRNAGFSRADSSQLYAPTITDPIYTYMSVNVEDQQRWLSSLWHWMRHVITVCKENPVFGRGDIRFLKPANQKFLAYIRCYEDQNVLCVHNLSKRAQYVELDLRSFEGYTPVELFGDTPFPVIKNQPYLLTLDGHTLYWFRLEEKLTTTYSSGGISMEFKRDTEVLTADGEKVGVIDRFVIDPRTKEVTHLVVKKGFLFPEDKVVPVDLIAFATEDQVKLKAVEGELELPVFEETYYTRVGAADRLYHYAPVGVAWWGYPGYLTHQDYAVATRQNIPQQTVAIEEGAKVVSADSEHVGNVQRVFMDEDTVRATHLVISSGMFLTTEKLIPTSWIETITEDEIFLAVDSEVLKGLPEFKG
jgi:maltose alpha-D-glucosyltransferase/alpha-amylase